MKRFLLHLCKISVLVCFMTISLSSFAAAQYQNGIPVLLYHHVSNDNHDLPELTTSPEEFERQISLLKANGFQTIPMTKLISFVKGEKIKLPDKPIVIAFDDGYLDNYTEAFPILKKYEFKANLFMVGINFDRKERLSSSQIREMAANGITIGGHSMTHPNLTSLDEVKLAWEVEGSKKKAEQVTHQAVEAFAYPGGFFNLAAYNAVQSAGYQGAFTVLTGLNRPGLDNVYLLRRIPIFSFTNFDRLLLLLNANHPKTSLLDYDV